jgi:hypothetical protein
VLDPGGEGHEGDQHDVQYRGDRAVDGNEHGMLPSRSILTSCPVASFPSERDGVVQMIVIVISLS